MHVKMAALQEADRSMYVMKERRVLHLMGRHFKHLNIGGASLATPSKSERILLGFICHGWPWSICQALRPATKLERVEPEYVPA